LWCDSAPDAYGAESQRSTNPPARRRLAASKKENEANPCSMRCKNRTNALNHPHF